MSKIANYQEFKKHQPKYEGWKKERDENLQKKVQYLKNNPIPNDEYNKEIEKAKIVLNAVDIMDEYSQSRAEDTEQIVQATSAGLSQVVGYISMGLATLSIFLSKGAKEAFAQLQSGNFKNITKLIPAALCLIIPTALVSSIIASWGASKQVQSSRLGRKDAMEKDLASLNQFAILDEQQKQYVDKQAKTIQVDKKEAKKTINATKGLGIKESIKTIFSKDDKEIIKTNVKLDERANLSEKEILEAKKDKELIQTIVEKIDISSQDYAENAELAVGTLQTASTASGIGLGALATYISCKIKPLARFALPIGLIVGVGTCIAGIIIGAKIDKQASRVGRFMAKQELLNNPEVLIYVDENKYKNEVVNIEPKKKKNYFSQVIQMLKDNIEYNKHIKENNTATIQKRKAKEQIQLSPEQKNRAQQLQKNVFNMFNKLDEKSQIYSESTEALGETITSILTSFISLPVVLISNMYTIGANTKLGKLKGLLATVSSFIIPIASNIIVTKEQKRASRVANMEAIEELNDYRYFINENASETTSIAISPALKNLLNKTT